MNLERFIDSYTEPRPIETSTPARRTSATLMKSFEPRNATTMVIKDGVSIRVIASPSSGYLLPELDASDFSLVQRGTVRFQRPGLSFRDGLLCLYGVSDALQAGQWGSWLKQAAGVPTFPTIVEPSAFGLSQPDVIEAPSEAPQQATPEVETGATDASVAAIASRIYELSGLGDERLAALFKVKRETFNRWRTGVLTNPRVGNRRRLALLLRLLEDLAAREVLTKDWLLNTAADEEQTPYDLLHRGRIDAVAYLATAIGAPTPIARAVESEERDLVFGNDDVWEVDYPDEDE